MKTTPMATRCPYCNEQFDFASGVGHDNPPDDGDVSFCIKCGSFAFFDETAPGGARMPEPEELRALLADPMPARLLQAWYETQARNRTA